MGTGSVNTGLKRVELGLAPGKDGRLGVNDGIGCSGVWSVLWQLDNPSANKLVNPTRMIHRTILCDVNNLFFIVLCA